MKTIDGSFGEGGGQILRSSLALAAVTQTAVEVVNVRAGRKKPGLLKQHLCAAKAAATVCNGKLDGAELGSRHVVLRPQAVQPGAYRFSVGSAGSAVLVLQTVLPPLLWADGPSTVTVEGGTHNRFAPPFEFLERVFRPALAAIGGQLELNLERAGFFPVGGGRIVAHIRPLTDPRPLQMTERVAMSAQRGVILTSALPGHVVRRERSALQARLGHDLDVHVVECESPGPGNAVLVEQTYGLARSIFTGFGERGRPAESVASEAADAATRFRAANVPVDEYLADQLLLPMALGRGGAFKTVALSAHSTTHIHVLEQLLDARIDVQVETSGGRTEALVQVARPASG